jgi:cytochrome c oxidase subunit 1
MMIGARDLAFPRINLLSWYLYMIGAVIVLWAIFSGGVDTGWTFYTPYSSKSAHTNVIPTIAGIFVAGFSSIATGLNFIVTMHRMRAPGLTWFRMPLFCWTMYATSVIILLGTPVVAITLALVCVERVWQLGIFDPALGGDPVLFQHLFWFYSHPAVYIMLLPGMAVVSEIVPCFARKNIFGYTFVAWASIGIAVLSFLVWAHHMFVAGVSVYGAMIFSFLSYTVAVPSAIKVFNWTATMYKGSVSYDSPMLFALGFIGLFTVGGLTGLFLAALGTDMHVHDTYFIIAHFHFIMVGGTVMAYLGGLHYWWPKMTGRMYPEGWARLAAGLIFVGFFLTFVPQFVLGYLGMPRRYHSYPPEWQVLNVMSSAGASILAVGYVLPLIYLLWSLPYGRPAGPNPWGATGLEWQTPSPPPTENFPVTPVVTVGPYEYSLDGQTEVVGGTTAAGVDHE